MIPFEFERILIFSIWIRIWLIFNSIQMKRHWISRRTELKWKGMGTIQYANMHDDFWCCKCHWQAAISLVHSLSSEMFSLTLKIPNLMKLVIWAIQTFQLLKFKAPESVVRNRISNQFWFPIVKWKMDLNVWRWISLKSTFN